MNKETLISKIDEKFKFQRKWRDINFVLSIIVSFMTITCTLLATIISGFHQDYWSSICAGIATVLVGMNKELFFHKKWKLHRTTTIQLEALRTKIECDDIDINEGVRQMNDILTKYTEKLPLNE